MFEPAREMILWKGVDGEAVVYLTSDDVIGDSIPSHSSLDYSVHFSVYW